MPKKNLRRNISRGIALRRRKVPIATFSRMPVQSNPRIYFSSVFEDGLFEQDHGNDPQMSRTGNGDGIRTASHAFALRKEAPPMVTELGTNGTKQSWEELRRALRSGKTLRSRPFSFHPRSSHSQEPQASLRPRPRFTEILPCPPNPSHSCAERSRGLLPNRSPGRTDRLTAAKRSTPHSVTWRTSRNLPSTSFFSTPCNGALKKNSLLGQFEGRTFMPETSPKFPILEDKENTLRT